MEMEFPRSRSLYQITVPCTQIEALNLKLLVAWEWDNESIKAMNDRLFNTV